MHSRAPNRLRVLRLRPLSLVVLVTMLLILILPPRAPFLNHPAHAAGLPGLHVSGNQLVDANGNPIILRGVNRSGLEYACIQGWGFFDGDNVLNDDSQVPLMKAWGINEVNLGINEDCWLNINGVPLIYGGANYISAVTHEVATLESYGIYPVISLFWEAPGTQQALDQTAMPDNDHAPALWQSIANTFKNDPRVIFRIKEEPYPAGNTDGASAWQCWKNGDVQYGATGSLAPVSSTANCSEGYKTAGMQSLINIIRGTGATNVIQVPGVEYSNSMTHFLDSSYRVSDTLSPAQLMGVVDVYPVGNICGSVTCYDSEYAPVIQQMPFMAGEFGESVDGKACGTTNVDALMQWFDQHSAGYSAWSWDTWGGCLQLIMSYITGAPYGNWGNDYESHLAAVNNATPTPTPTGAPPTATRTPTSTPTSATPTATSEPTSTATATPTATKSSALILGNFENSTEGYTGSFYITGEAPSTYAPAVALGSYALWTKYTIASYSSMVYIYKAVNINLSSYTTLSASIFAQQPTVSGPGVKVQFMVQGSNGSWYYSPFQVVPIGTRTTVSWNMGSVPRSPLKQLRVCWKFTTSAKSSGNQLYVDAIKAS